VPTAAPTRRRPCVVLAGVGVHRGLAEVLDGDQAFQLEVVVDDQHLFDAVLVQQRLALLQDSPSFTVTSAVLRRHDG
jgi:hypothetical protein